MKELQLSITIQAPIERCFDLARSMDFHTWSMKATGEKIVSGRPSGLIELGEFVEFEAAHLGLVRRLRAKITKFNRPRSFMDEQDKGPFRTFRHEHRFSTNPDNPSITLVEDHLYIVVGWSVFGLIAERALVVPHLQRLLTQHQFNLKAALEGEEWKRFLPQT